MKKLNLYSVIFIILLNSCGGDVGKVLKNEKKRTTDEFLVKQREPLKLPPDYQSIPKPESLSKKNEKKIDSIIKIPKKDSVNQSGSSIEESIINAIRK
tara:strand:- start:52 stop:345 length:294 start_codon:yes stop_codon:yes gene_type:complete